MRTLQREFPSVKHRPPTEEKTNVIYKIPCKDCPWNYIGETGRSLKTRKSEHVRNVKQNKDGSNIAKHAWDCDHVIDFDISKVIDKGKFRNRLTLYRIMHGIQPKTKMLITTLSHFLDNTQP